MLMGVTSSELGVLRVPLIMVPDTSLCRDNLGRHPIILMDRPAHRRTSPVAQLDELVRGNLFSVQSLS
jgi:hypothetical protein